MVGGIALASLATVAVTAGMNSSTVQATDIQYKTIIRPSLVISIPSTPIAINLDPGSNAFQSQNINVNVATNNANGYQMYMSSDSTALTDAESGSTIDALPSQSGGYTEETFTANHWGWNANGGNWQSYNGNQLVMSSAGPTNGGTSTIGLATKIDYETIPGTYSNILNFKVVAPGMVTNMQDLDPTLCVTDSPLIVSDARDGQTYSVQRLADGKCWMTQNLKLGKESTSLALTSADSDVSSFTLTGKLSDGEFTSETVDGISYQNNSSQYYCTDAYGCYYNWYTATAGTGLGSTTSGSVESSICPKGWKLPTGGSGGEFKALATAYGISGGYDATEAAAMLVANPTTTTENTNGAAAPGFLLGGYYAPVGVYFGEIGSYWSRTAYDAYAVYSLYLQDNHVESTNTYHVERYTGRSVRCLLSES